jgi:hypothetical protein
VAAPGAFSVEEAKSRCVERVLLLPLPRAEVGVGVGGSRGVTENTLSRFKM